MAVTVVYYGPHGSQQEEVFELGRGWATCPTDGDLDILGDCPDDCDRTWGDCAEGHQFGAFRAGTWIFIREQE